MLVKLRHCAADTQMGNGFSGSPLTQMLVYALHHNCPKVVNGEIVQLLIGRDLNVNVFDS